ncbi:Phage-related lysozyme (muraminidase) (COG3772) [uncultured Mediterranean phage uvMED]|nr:Phage-related lysozyme (muraminidase) (COG3772) [uncultured Mediterranean phage uvMED]
MNLEQLIEFEEGFKDKAYLCTEGYVTIGIGEKIGPKCTQEELAYYYGDMTMPKSAAYELLTYRLQNFRAQVQKQYGAQWCELSEPRRIILLSMAYQLGVKGLFKFKNMINALKHEDYSEAYEEALDSRWARQTENRAIRHATVLRDGNFDCYC